MIKGAFSRLRTARELFGFLWHHKVWWLVPLVAVLLVSGLMAVAVQSSAIAPFIYTLF